MPTHMLREVTIANRHPRLRVDRRAVARAIHLLDQRFAAGEAHARRRLKSCPEGELSLVFVRDEELAALHGRFLDDPSITDVITFEGDAALSVAGEICVSADAADRQTRMAGPARGKRSPTSTKGRSRADGFSRELTLYVVHGWLHLAGYDDLQPAKKRVMRRAETRAMKILDETAAVPEFRLRDARR